jgi:hypothetical protein
MSVSGLSFACASKKTGVRAGPCAAGSSLAMRRHAMMFGLLIASFAANEPARAAARRRTTAANPLLNATVTCTGTTINQNDSRGYGTRKQINLNICRPAPTPRRRKPPRQAARRLLERGSHGIRKWIDLPESCFGALRRQ